MNPHSRPVFLNLLRIRLPLPALVSIAHRLSGVLMAFSIPLMIYLLDLSLRDQASFSAISDAFADSYPLRLLLVLLYWSWAHHLLCGIRYLLIDLDIGVSRITARWSAWLVIGGGALVLLAATGSLL